MSLSKLQQMVEGQGSLLCCSPWGHRESDTTEQLNINNGCVALTPLAVWKSTQMTWELGNWHLGWEGEPTKII